jgi:hypothetical protein
VLSQSEVFGLFRRRQDNRTRLRFAAQFHGVSRLSIETVIARVESPLIGVDLADHGYRAVVRRKLALRVWCSGCDEKRANRPSGYVVH